MVTLNTIGLKNQLLSELIAKNHADSSIDATGLSCMAELDCLNNVSGICADKGMISDENLLDVIATLAINDFINGIEMPPQHKTHEIDNFL